MSRQLVEVPPQVPGGCRVEFFADDACTVPVELAMTESSRRGRAFLLAPRSELLTLFAPDCVRDVWARWVEPVADLAAGSLGEQSRVVRCRKVAVPVVSGRW